MNKHIRAHQIVVELCADEFELSLGRKPQDQGEFDAWAWLVEKGLLNGHIDWDILYECACGAMPHGAEGGK